MVENVRDIAQLVYSLADARYLVLCCIVGGCVVAPFQTT
jgi:hypothetical protein